ncbi:hypothetical protein ALC53_11327 [Atta colombica]|uniref:Uncharacterized protein n=1 Tax=Atta colombica TaxID=520822 RepID=A0A151HZQ3_9HYME|nr:hypothetical protein ALC53_11327 [Atta colombica]
MAKICEMLRCNKASSFLSFLLLRKETRSGTRNDDHRYGRHRKPRRTSFLSLASPGERNDPGLTNRGAGTSASRRALSTSSVERTRPERKRGRGYIGRINRIPIRGTCHLTASENLESYSRDNSSPKAELRHFLEKSVVARFEHKRMKILLFVSLDNLNYLDMSMVFVHSSFREKHSLQIRVKHDTRSTEVRKLRSEEFLSQSSVLLGGSSDLLRTRRAQDADAAF